jgi:Sugar (and other) transporter
VASRSSVRDQCPLNARYWSIFGLLSLVGIVDFFDFFSVGFLVAVIGPQWHLTYGAAAAILLGGGIGAILGSLAGGAFGDLWGRKAMVVGATFICAFGGAAIAVIPNGAWVLFAVLRFLVGFGLGASSFATIARASSNRPLAVSQRADSGRTNRVPTPTSTGTTPRAAMPRQPISPSSAATVAEARKPPRLAERTKRLETTVRCRVGVSSTTIVVAGANDFCARFGSEHLETFNLADPSNRHRPIQVRRIQAE